MVVTIADTKDALLVSKNGINQTLLIKKASSIGNNGRVDLSMVGESGLHCQARLLRAACQAAADGHSVLESTRIIRAAGVFGIFNLVRGMYSCICRCQEFPVATRRNFFQEHTWLW